MPIQRGGAQAFSTICRSFKSADGNQARTIEGDELQKSTHVPYFFNWNSFKAWVTKKKKKTDEKHNLDLKLFRLQVTVFVWSMEIFNLSTKAIKNLLLLRYQLLAPGELLLKIRIMLHSD